MTTRALLRTAAPRAAFGRIVLNEARLAWRVPTGLIFGLGLPVLLLVLFGELPSFQQHRPGLGSLTVFDVYVPILIAFVIAALSLLSLPGPLASYREQGVLRRLSVTPAPPAWVLAAQILIGLCIAAIALLTVIIAGVTVFGAATPRNLGGLVVSVLLSIAGLFGIGLTIAAVAKSPRSAGAIGGITFYPMLFFAGLWLPQQLMPAVLRDISGYTPLGAAVTAIGDSVQGEFPPAVPLLVLAGYAVAFGFLARKIFRWE